MRSVRRYLTAMVVALAMALPLAHALYRELAGVQPHLLLADYVKAFHPELLPHYVPQYYKLID